jgi:hypothetical protein
MVGTEARQRSSKMAGGRYRKVAYRHGSSYPLLNQNMADKMAISFS